MLTKAVISDETLLWTLHWRASPAGLPAEAVSVLQEAGEWRYAATLMAATLTAKDLAPALERWAHHVLEVGFVLRVACGLTCGSV